MKKCKSCQSEIDDKAKKCPKCQADQRNWFVRHKIITIVLAIILLVIISGSSEKDKEKVDTLSSTNNNIVDSSLLMANNDPDVKHLTTMTADYVGKTFDIYVNAKASNYYNYGFRDENSYYSMSLWDNSANEFQNVYGYIDKKDPKSKDLMNKIIDKPTILKINAIIPVDKYETGSNSFLKINSWEEVK